MTAEALALVLAVLAVIAALYLRGLAGRLDRLHLRLEAATAALDTRLLRRAALSHELASSGWLDPASSVVLISAATAAETEPRAAGPAAPGAAGDAAQSDLSAALRAVLDDPETLADLDGDADAHDLLIELADAAQGVLLARRFANDAVQAVIAVRSRSLVQAFRLAGHAPWPATRDLDDAPPRALAEISRGAA